MARPEFAAYQARLEDRRAYALQVRRQMNAGKVHVYRTAIAVPFNPSMPMGNFHEMNRVWQPPIPRRRTFLDWLDDYADRLERITYDVPRL